MAGFARPAVTSLSVNDDSGELEAKEATLSDKLKVFKTSQFDPNGYVTSKCQTMSEKEIKHLCSYLGELKKASAEEMRKSVYANYTSFIRTSKEISDLEGELLSMRNLLNTQAALVHGLAEGVRVDALFNGSEGSAADDKAVSDDKEDSKIEKWWAQFLESLEVLMAERRVDEALDALDEGERVAEDANDKQTLNPIAVLSLQTTISEQRTMLADQLAEAASQPSTRGAELHSAIMALKRLGDGPRAHTLLLCSHEQKLKSDMQGTRPSTTLYGGAYIAQLSHLVFSTIARAASDSLAAFGEEPAYASELVTWAVKQVESYAMLLKRHTLASAAASGGLRAATECVQMCMGYCSSLEARGMSLSPVLLRFFRPCVEQALTANLRRIGQSTAALAAADDWALIYSPLGARPLAYSSTTSLSSLATSQPKLSSSAHRFNTMAQEFFEEVGCLESLLTGIPILDGILDVFNNYVSLLINALPGSVDTEETPELSGNKIVRMAESEAQQIALLANASLLAEELLPRAAMKLLPSQQHQGNRMDTTPRRASETPRRASERQNRNPEQREWKRKLQKAVERLRDSFCRVHALELIFNEEGDVLLSAQIYTRMDGYAEEPEWFPSPIFQELFLKLTRVASIASDMFVGRERFATILLIRMTETVILWLSNDQTFWEEIEEGPTPLGRLGLQQFYLDMEFVLFFASQGRYLSRNLHQVIKNLIGRAVEAVGATGLDPCSVLPEDEWFAEVSQIATKMLTGKANFSTLDQDVTSPTASVSAASVLSHGSN
uniref:Exocyst component Exo84 C-terminal domain-containing protein n=1 Tax=Kalanchoe fedtschenkoi TaxID=63787 RepID=A0A7N0U0R7_KALFE